MQISAFVLLNLVILSSFVPLAPAEEPATAPQPNIVFFIADDMQRYMFNCLAEGEPPYLTPNLDRLAAEGTLMTEQYVSAPNGTSWSRKCNGGNGIDTKALLV